MARHRIQVLRAGGKTLRRIAAETGISLRSVKRIVLETPIESPGDVASAKARGVGRPSKVEEYRARIAEVLAAEPKLPTVEVRPGEFSQHDIGEVRVRYLDRSEERIHFFASRLKYSRWVDVESERIEAPARRLLAGFAGRSMSSKSWRRLTPNFCMGRSLITATH